MNQFVSGNSVSRVITVTNGAAGTTDIESSVVDTSDCEGVVFILQMGAIVSGAVTSAKVQQGAASNLSDAADLTGTSQTIADTDDDEVFVFDVRRPRERYVRLYVDRGTQNATCSAIAIKYGVRNQPVTHGTGVNAEAFAYPAEGTA